MMNRTALRTFDNTAGEGIVTFQPSCVQGPEWEADPLTWYHHLLVDGQRVFEYGCPCGTCGILFRKVGSTSHRLDDGRAYELLGRLETVPSGDALSESARVLEPGVYHPLVLEGSVELVEPGSQRDFFATDVVRLFGLEPPDCEQPSGPYTAYYRYGPQAVLERSGRVRGGPHRALVTSVLMPLHSPAELQRERVEYWKSRHTEGLPLTALSVAVIDDQAPAVEPPDDTYPYEEQFLFANCMLDGHHRVQAAAELGVTVRVLSLLTLGRRSMVHEKDVAVVTGPFSIER